MTAPGFAAIDFGTSNSAIALPAGRSGVDAGRAGAWPPHHAHRGVLPGRRARAPLRPRRHRRLCRRLDGRLMRSMKSVLGSSLIEQSTDVGGGRAVKLPRRHRRLPAAPEAAWPRPQAGAPLPAWCWAGRCSSSTTTRARRARAGGAGSGGAQRWASSEVLFQFEPIAAALDHERQVDARAAGAGGRHRRRHLGLLLVRVGPQRRGRSTGATTSWPTTACTSPAPTSTAMSSWRPSCRCWATGRCARPRRGRARCPAVYFDLATWHLINTVYTPARGRAAQHAQLLRRPRHHRG
jgi:hypothetical chaperone protein